MKREVLGKAGIGYAVTICLILYSTRQAEAGWNISVNAATGFGSAWVSVTPPSGSGKTVTTPAVSFPSVAIPGPVSGFTYGGSLPTGANSASYAQAKALSGLVFQHSASLKSVTGDNTGNTNVTSLVNIGSADCATLTMDSSTYLSNDMVSGTIIVNAAGTPGTGLLLRGYEFAGPPPINSDGSINLDQLVAEGALKFNLLLVGPFDLSTTNCNAIVIPFTTLTGYTNLYFISDGASQSNPLKIACPGNMTVACGTTTYPPVQVTSGGCGGLTNVSYSPKASALIAGITNTVTATATDTAGNTATCTFQVYLQPVAFNGFFSPIGGTGGSCAAPFVSINQGSKIPVKFQDFCNGAALGGGQPTMTVQLVTNTNTCALSTVFTNNFQFTASVWHANWDTSTFAKGTYKVTATLQDGSQQFVYIKLN